MAQPARRRRTHPAISSVSSSSTPPEPPDEGGEDAQEEAEDMVVCFLSGARLHKSEAVRVRLGPGKVMWMAKELTNQG